MPAQRIGAGPAPLLKQPLRSRAKEQSGMITLEHIEKTYPARGGGASVTALADTTLTIEKGEIFGSSDTLYHLPRGAKEPTKREFPETDTFSEEIGHFADCLREGKRPLHSVEEGRAVLDLILQASQTAQGWQKTAVVR